MRRKKRRILNVKGVSSGKIKKRNILLVSARRERAASPRTVILCAISCGTGGRRVRFVKIFYVFDNLVKNITNLLQILQLYYTTLPYNGCRTIFCERNTCKGEFYGLRNVGRRAFGGAGSVPARLQIFVGQYRKARDEQTAGMVRRPRKASRRSSRVRRRRRSWSSAS